ncbi:hypothetical protein AAXE64_27310 [Priestia megaterium]|uniref:hypothetical protein n=1 Tax=Priestia megaterium TaxID=1404 RepID=UPI003CFC0F94
MTNETMEMNNIEEVVENHELTEAVTSEEFNREQELQEAEARGFVVGAFEGGEAMREITLEENKKVIVQVGVGAFLLGLLTGAAGGYAAWFKEKKKRLALLKTIQRTTAIANAINKGETTVQFEKQEIDLAKKLAESNNKFNLMEEIREQVNSVKMSKKEKQQWIDEMTNIVALAESGVKEDTVKILEEAQKQQNQTINTTKIIDEQ